MSETNLAMSLVDDELINFPCGSRDHEFRVRIWRAIDHPAVVLVTQARGFHRPSAVTARMANLVYSAYLLFDPQGMFFFEADPDGAIRSVGFTVFGAAHRKRLVSPTPTAIEKYHLDDIVGESVAL